MSGSFDYKSRISRYRAIHDALEYFKNLPSESIEETHKKIHYHLIATFCENPGSKKVETFDNEQSLQERYMQIVLENEEKILSGQIPSVDKVEIYSCNQSH